MQSNTQQQFMSANKKHNYGDIFQRGITSPQRFYSEKMDEDQKNQPVKSQTIISNQKLKNIQQQLSISNESIAINMQKRYDNNEKIISDHNYSSNNELDNQTSNQNRKVGQKYKQKKYSINIYTKTNDKIDKVNANLQNQAVRMKNEHINEVQEINSGFKNKTQGINYDINNGLKNANNGFNNLNEGYGFNTKLYQAQNNIIKQQNDMKTKIPSEFNNKINNLKTNLTDNINQNQFNDPFYPQNDRSSKDQQNQKYKKSTNQLKEQFFSSKMPQIGQNQFNKISQNKLYIKKTVNDLNSKNFKKQLNSKNNFNQQFWKSKNDPDLLQNFQMNLNQQSKFKQKEQKQSQYLQQIFDKMSSANVFDLKLKNNKQLVIPTSNKFKIVKMINLKEDTQNDALINNQTQPKSKFIDQQNQRQNLTNNEAQKAKISKNIALPNEQKLLQKQKILPAQYENENSLKNNNFNSFQSKNIKDIKNGNKQFETKKIPKPSFNQLLTLKDDYHQNNNTKNIQRNKLDGQNMNYLKSNKLQNKKDNQDLDRLRFSKPSPIMPIQKNKLVLQNNIQHFQTNKVKPSFQSPTNNTSANTKQYGKSSLIKFSPNSQEHSISKQSLHKKEKLKKQFNQENQFTSESQYQSLQQQQQQEHQQQQQQWQQQYEQQKQQMQQEQQQQQQLQSQQQQQLQSESQQESQQQQKYKYKYEKQQQSDVTSPLLLEQSKQMDPKENGKSFQHWKKQMGKKISQNVSSKKIGEDQNRESNYKKQQHNNKKKEKSEQQKQKRKFMQEKQKLQQQKIQFQAKRRREELQNKQKQRELYQQKIQLQIKRRKEEMKNKQKQKELEKQLAQLSEEREIEKKLYQEREKVNKLEREKQQWMNSQEEIKKQQIKKQQQLQQFKRIQQESEKRKQSLLQMSKKQANKQLLYLQKKKKVKQIAIETQPIPNKQIKYIDQETNTLKQKKSEKVSAQKIKLSKNKKDFNFQDKINIKATKQQIIKQQVVKQSRKSEAAIKQIKNNEKKKVNSIKEQTIKHQNHKSRHVSPKIIPVSPSRDRNLRKQAYRQLSSNKLVHSKSTNQKIKNRVLMQESYPQETNKYDVYYVNEPMYQRQANVRSQRNIETYNSHNYNSSSNHSVKRNANKKAQYMSTSNDIYRKDYSSSKIPQLNALQATNLVKPLFLVDDTLSKQKRTKIEKARMKMRHAFLTYDSARNLQELVKRHSKFYPAIFIFLDQQLLSFATKVDLGVNNAYFVQLIKENIIKLYPKKVQVNDYLDLIQVANRVHNQDYY